MRRQVVLLPIVLLTRIVPVWADGGHAPTVRAGAAVVNVEATTPGRRLVQLPSLEFPLQITPHCEPGAAVESVSISVADTRLSYGKDDFRKQLLVKTTLRLPGRQLGPLAIDNACADDRPDDDQEIEEAYSASVSLRCSNGEQESVSYETLALTIRLVCPVGGAATADDPDDSQDASSPDDSSTIRF